MALTEETIQDKIEIVGEHKHVQIRTATVIKRDGAPDADITGESAEVQAICAAVHTQAVKDAYAIYLAAEEAEGE